jgi:hypothetical protein
MRQRPPRRESQPLQPEREEKAPVRSISPQALFDALLKGLPLGLLQYGWFLHSRVVALPGVVRLLFPDVAVYTALLESVMIKVAAGIGAVLLAELAASVRRVRRGNIPRSKLVGHVVFTVLTILLAWICSDAARTIVVSTCSIATWFSSEVPRRTAGHMLALKASIAGAMACCGLGSFSSGLPSVVVHKGRAYGSTTVFEDHLSINAPVGLR